MAEKFYRWYDEPDGVGLRIDPNYIKNLVIRAKTKAGSFVNLAKLTGLSVATLSNYKNNISLNIKGLKSLLDYLNINYNRINHKILKIGWNNTMLDIDLNSNDMAIILCASLADGHINQSHFMYKNKDLELINRVKNSVWKLFGNYIKINDRIDKNGTPYILCPSFVKRQLERLGSPKGKKLFQNPHVPEIIMKGNLEQKRLFIQQFFDDEGWPEEKQRAIAASQSSDTTSVLTQDFI
ncbi:MAG: hypothetical protein AABX19_04145, partial [Nanoarchaeota archaeon]